MFSHSLTWAAMVSRRIFCALEPVTRSGLDLDKERHGPKTGTYGQQYSCVFARPETAESVEHGRAE
jgi:hypothetical protein